LFSVLSLPFFLFRILKAIGRRRLYRNNKNQGVCTFPFLYFNIKQHVKHVDNWIGFRATGAGFLLPAKSAGKGAFLRIFAKIIFCSFAG
jgi:hypothetical protein